MNKLEKILSLLTATIFFSLALVSCARQPTELLALEITSPQSNAEVTKELMIVSGIVSSPEAMVTINEVSVEVSEDGDFATTFPLDYGENSFTISASMEGQEPITKTVNVTRLLALEITAPEDNAEVTESLISVQGSVSDPAAVVTVNDREVRLTEDGTFLTAVELDYVKNEIVVNAAVENQRPITKTVNVSRVLVLELVSPQYQVVVTDGEVTITGVVSPPTAVVTINGTEVAVAGDGTFSAPVEVGYGENVIKVNATDPVTETITIIRRLELELLSPRGDEETSEDQIIVTGVVSDPAATIIANESEVTANEDGTFSAAIALEYGPNSIIVSATANGEDPIDKTVIVTRVLSLEIDSPADNTEVTEGTLSIEGTVSDTKAIVTVNSEEVTLTEEGTFSANVTLDEGENIITISASIDGQEQVSKTVTVTYAPAE